jgi:hypothetical protein
MFLKQDPDGNYIFKDWFNRLYNDMKDIIKGLGGWEKDDDCDSLKMLLTIWEAASSIRTAGDRAYLQARGYVDPGHEMQTNDMQKQIESIKDRINDPNGPCGCSDNRPGGRKKPPEYPAKDQLRFTNEPQRKPQVVPTPGPGPSLNRNMRNDYQLGGGSFWYSEMGAEGRAYAQAAEAEHGIGYGLGAAAAAGIYLGSSYCHCQQPVGGASSVLR